MKIFRKERTPDGCRHIYMFGMRIFSYKKHQSKFVRVYARRFDGLNAEEIRFCLKKIFRKHLGYRLNLDNPKTFNEKLQWLKLYYRNPLMTICADKVAVREYIAQKIGEQYLIPCLGVWDNPDDIEFDKLPNKFVLKVNWGSGQNIIVRDKAKLDINDARKKLAEWIKPIRNHYFNFFEWCYKDIKPKIIAEQYIEQMDGNLLDYKIMCYNGVAKNLLICSDRYSGLKISWFDLNWNRLPFARKYPQSSKKFKCPPVFNQMIDISNTLASEFPFVRVDFFYMDDKLYIGELTFYPGAGLEKFKPHKWDKKLGDLLTLPKTKKIPVWDYNKKTDKQKHVIRLLGIKLFRYTSPVK